MVVHRQTSCHWARRAQRYGGDAGEASASRALPRPGRHELPSHGGLEAEPGPQPDQPNHRTPGYRPGGLISPDDPEIFAGYTKLDFLWSLTRAR